MKDEFEEVHNRIQQAEDRLKTDIDLINTDHEKRISRLERHVGIARR